MIGSRLTWIGILASLGLAACATSGARDASIPGASVVSSEERGDGSLTRTDSIAITARVEAVDPETRMVTLRGPDGEQVTFRANDDVRNLDQVEKGDEVRIEFVEALVVKVRKPGDALPGVSAGRSTERAEPGAKPAGASIDTLTVTSTVTEVDRESRTLTLRSADGALATVPVRDAAQLDHVAVGDLVEVTATQAIAIAVEDPDAN